MSTHVAILRWIPASRGGRTAPPPNAVGYTTPVRVESDPTEARGAWSVRIHEARQLRGPDVLVVRVAPVVPEAPADLLREGERFEFMEGRRVVAKGVVLPASVRIPEQIDDFELALLG